MHSRRLTCAIMLFLPALVVAADWPTDGPVWIAGVFGEYHQGDEFAPGEYLATYHSGIDIPAANPSDPHATHIRAVSQERFHAAYSEFTLPGSNTVVNKVGPYIHQTVRRFQGWSNGQPAPIIYLPLDIGQYATFYMLDVWEVYNVTTGQALPILELWEDTSYHDYNGNPVPGCFRREVVLACPTPAATDEIRVGWAYYPAPITAVDIGSGAIVHGYEHIWNLWECFHPSPLPANGYCVYTRWSRGVARYPRSPMDGPFPGNRSPALVTQSNQAPFFAQVVCMA